MDIKELARIIEGEIEGTKDYSELLKRLIEPALVAIGSEHGSHLHFFNIGYQFALEKIKTIIEGGSHEITLPIC